VTAARATRVAIFLACAGALRVAIFALAFPFFNDVDEHQHVDSVVRYARGELPGPRMHGLDPRVSLWALEFGSFEYLAPGPEIPLPYLQRPGASLRDPLVRRANQAFLAVPNTEHDSPPVYFALAGLWMRVGETLGLDDAPLLFWLRWLNAGLLASLVFGAFAVLSRIAPERSFVFLGVPALLAFSPQDCLFGITTDGAAIATGGAAFLGLAWLAARTGPAAPRAYAAVGLAVAAAFLTKYTSLFLVVGSAVVAVGELRRSGEGGLPAWLRRWGAWAAGAGVPVAFWLLRNRLVLGDWSGTARKVAHLEWSARPIAAWLDHPIFEPGGLARFVGELIPRFWRGEFLWHGEMMASSTMDAAYVGATLVALGAVAVSRLRRPAASPGDAAVGRIDGLALWAVGAAVATLVLLSVRFEFADWGTPTADDPYFYHGRLISGAVLPVCWLFVRGLEIVCGALPEGWRAPAAAVALSLWITAVTVSEAVVNAPAFSSDYNAFG
jgi:hypothetical protein